MIFDHGASQDLGIESLPYPRDEGNYRCKKGMLGLLLCHGNLGLYSLASINGNSGLLANEIEGRRDLV